MMKPDGKGGVGRLRCGLLRVEALGAGVNLVERIDLGGRGVRALIYAGEGRAGDPVFDRRPGGDENVVLVHAHHVRTLACQDSDDPEGDILYADFFSDRGLTLEEFGYESQAENGDLAAVSYIPFGKHFTFMQTPVANIQVAGRCAEDEGGHPVAIAVNDLRASPDDRG